MVDKITFGVIFKLFILFLIGGTAYFCIEVLWRGNSHISMLIVGGICFILIGAVNNHFPWSLGLVQQTLISALVITVVEFISGMLINIGIDLNVWDYSTLPFNLFGQICLLYSVLWIPLSVIGIFLDDWLRCKLFKEEKPHYTII